VNFASDNVAGISPEIVAAIAAASTGTAAPYGDDALTARVESRCADIFEHQVAVFPVATGTAANALALASLMPPWSVVYCHEAAHILGDECGAPEFFGGGVRISGIAGNDGKLDAASLATALGQRGGHGVHHMQAAAVSITQASEAGRVYAAGEIAAIAEVARGAGLKLHMDGSRFANAVASLDCAPADITWRAGVDVLCLGATKNGAACAEAVVFFDPADAAEFAFRRKRGGHLLSKMRFISAQLVAYLADDLWLRNARHANRMAARLADGLASLPGIRLRYPVEANEVFVDLPDRVSDGLLAAGFGFYPRGGHGDRFVRLVTAFSTIEADVDAFVAAATALTDRPGVR
jgi:threonine aldolase